MTAALSYIWLAGQIYKGSGAMQQSSASIPATVPPEFLPYLTLVNADNVRAQYPAHHVRPTFTSYLALLWFLQQRPHYEFMFCIEEDVRLIGHWGTFFSAVLKFAAAAPEQDYLHVHRTDSRTGELRAFGSASLAGTPADYVAFADINRMAGKLHRQKPEHATIRSDAPFSMREQYDVQLHIRERYKVMIMVQGWSRALMNDLHELSILGQGAYDEHAVPTIAMHAKRKVVAVKHPQFYGDSYHCCTKGAEHYYSEFVKNPEACKRYALLHPVKFRLPINSSQAGTQI